MSEATEFIAEPTTQGEAARIIERFGWEQEAGRRDDGCWFVHVWNDWYGETFHSKHYSAMDGLYIQAARFVLKMKDRA